MQFYVMTTTHQSINQHIYLNITATVAGLKKTNTPKFDINPNMLKIILMTFVLKGGG